MLVMRPIRWTSPCAMKPVINARTTDQAQMTTTRASMAAFSMGTREAASLAIGRFLSAAAASGARPLVVLEEHRCRSGLGAQCVDECGEGVGEAFALRGGEPFDHAEDFLLRHRGGAQQQGTAVLGEVEDEAARVA